MCLPLPENYRLPEHGDLAEGVAHALVAQSRASGLYILGPPGSGKGALAHALSAYTRTQGVIHSIKPGVDIQSWFYTRGFDAGGTAPKMLEVDHKHLEIDHVGRFSTNTAGRV